MPMRVRAVLLIGALGLGVAPSVVAQTPTPGVLTFDAVSVKPNTSESLGGRGGLEPGGLWVEVNVSGAGLIKAGYPSKIDELVGAPDWLNRERFDVTARAASEPTPEQLRVMIRAFLADRFKLAAHYETEERSVYSLTLSRSDGRLGPQIHAIPIDCASFKRDPSVPVPKGEAPPCTFSMSAGTTITITSGGRTMETLANLLSGLVGRPVVDNTGLGGDYAFSLTCDCGENGAAIFTAIQEQLGLKLEAKRSALEKVVIDHIERPTED